MLIPYHEALDYPPATVLRRRLTAHCTFDSRYANSPAWRKAALLARIYLAATEAAALLPACTHPLCH